MSAVYSAMASSAVESPSEMPVPTELPTSPVDATLEVPTLTVDAEAGTLLSGVPTATATEMLLPVRSAALGSSALGSSALVSPSEMPVPTEMPTSPVSSHLEPPSVQVPRGTGQPSASGLPDSAVSRSPSMPPVPTDVPSPQEVPVPGRSAVYSSMASSAVESPSEMPVPTELPTSPVDATVEVPTVDAEAGTLLSGVPTATEMSLPVRSAALGSSALGSSALVSPTEMPVPTEMPTSPVLSTSRLEAPSLEVPRGTGQHSASGLPDSAVSYSPSLPPVPTDVPSPQEVPVPGRSAVYSAFGSSLASSVESPSEMPVPTELPTSPVDATMEVPTADAEAGTLLSGVPTATELPLPVRSAALGSSALGSSALAPSPSEMPVPTEMPTSPVLSTSRLEAPSLEVPHAAEPSAVSGEFDLDVDLPVPDQSALSSAPSPASPVEMPVPTEMPTSPTEEPFFGTEVPTVEGTVLSGVPTQTQEVPPLRSGAMSSALGSSAVGLSPSEMPVPTELPTSPQAPRLEMPSVEVPRGIASAVSGEFDLDVELPVPEQSALMSSAPSPASPPFEMP
ncbi:unnamed protein product, partial [Effrenium voratum]